MDKKAQNGRELNVPPPIIVYGVANIRPVQDLLQEIVGDEYSMKLLANDQVEIQLKDKDKIEPLTAGLRSKNTIFEISKKKKEETYKVILRNMHPSIETESIIKELELYGHKVMSISNVKDETTKEPMPLFHIELETRENNEDIYSLTKLSNMIVAFEPVNQRKTFLRCTKCQSIGHTESSCDNVVSDTEKSKNDAPTSSSTASSEPTATPTSATVTPIAYVQPIRSRAPKNRRQNPPNSNSSSSSASASRNRGQSSQRNTYQEQMSTMYGLYNLESIVNSTVSSLESMLLLTANLTQRLR